MTKRQAESRYAPRWTHGSASWPLERPWLVTDNPRSIGNDADDVLTPRAAENPVVSALKARGLYKTLLGSGTHDVSCPWAQEHTDGLDTCAAYFEPDELYG